jgi:hypothetical protein
MMPDYQVELLFRDITEEDAIRKAIEIQDYLVMSGRTEFETFVMEVIINEDTHGMSCVHHWPEDAKGPFRDIIWTEEEEEGA